MKSYENRGYFIDISSRTFKEVKVNDIIYRMYLGGKGLANKLLYDYGIWNYDPFSPQNMLVFSSGPLGGVPIPLSTRAWVGFRSPLTGILGGANVGGTLAAIMKYSGVDFIQVVGKSSKPTYLVITKEGVEFYDADHLWGKDSIETEEILKKDHGKASAVLAIGPAGENLVRFASINHEKWRQFGRTGPGAVMGSKLLKAIVFTPYKRTIEVAYPDELAKFLKEFIPKLLSHPSEKSYREKGTPGTVEVANRLGFFPSYYWSEGTLKEWERISWENLKKNYFLGPAGCLYCPLACHRNVKSKKFSVEEDIEYETLYSLGGLTGTNDPDWIIYLNDLTDRLGMDTMSLGNVLGFAIQLSKMGKIDIRLDWNEPEKLKELIFDIAYRRGIGNILAEGVRIASEKFNAEDIAVHVKGLEPAGYDPRTLKGMALNYAIAGRGADHLGTMAYAIDIAGRAGGMQSLGEEKVKAIIDYENLSSVMDSAILCKFGRYVYDFTTIAKLLNYVTGMEFNENDVRTIGERITNITRLINVRMGVDRRNDRLPKKFFEPLKVNDTVYRLTEEEFHRALDTYYKYRGWDENGIPTVEKLGELKIY